eukprot:GDKI01032913.1.p2 GENE.GDKI01032913.1~~GDKI01032913.1.p2  ORF type:complete len:121 (+),score=30.74 GDKI01032913.1:480-842(+)
MQLGHAHGERCGTYVNTQTHRRPHTGVRTNTQSNACRESEGGTIDAHKHTQANCAHRCKRTHVPQTTHTNSPTNQLVSRSQFTAHTPLFDHDTPPHTPHYPSLTHSALLYAPSAITTYSR